MMLQINCHIAHVYGDHIDTDVIIPARYLSASTPQHLAKYCMINIDPEFANIVQGGDLIISGRNFGCGSSREHAPMAIKASGIHCVIAKSFARIFLRNAINIGLTVIEADTDALNAQIGDLIKINWKIGAIINRSGAIQIPFSAPPPFIHEIITAGGLLAYVTELKEGLKRYGAKSTHYQIALLSGDGIGPEILAEAVKVLKALELKFEFHFDFIEAPIRGASSDHSGLPLTKPSAFAKSPVPSY